MSSPEERAEFSKRLRTSLARIGCAQSPSLLAKEFNTRTADKSVTMFAARKWLMGEAIPTQEKVQVLAEWLAVSSQWLRFGEGAGLPTQRVTKSQKTDPGEKSMLAGYQRLSETHRLVVREMISILLRVERKRPARADG